MLRMPDTQTQNMCEYVCHRLIHIYLSVLSKNLPILPIDDRLLIGRYRCSMFMVAGVIGGGVYRAYDIHRYL